MNKSTICLEMYIYIYKKPFWTTETAIVALLEAPQKVYLRMSSMSSLFSSLS